MTGAIKLEMLGNSSKLLKSKIMVEFFGTDAKVEIAEINTRDPGSGQKSMNTKILLNRQYCFRVHSRVHK